MKKILNLLVLLFIIFAGLSCEEDPAFDFKDDGKLYFKYPNKVTSWGEVTNIPVDSIVYSLFGKGEKDTLWIEVQIMGARQDRDRKFALEVLKDSCSGREGEDFENLQSEYTFHAGKGVDVFPIIFNKSAFKDVLSRNVLLSLKSTEDLGIAYKEFSTLKINYSAYIPEPDWWWAFSFVLGDFHPLKYEKVIELYGSPDVDPYGNNPYCIYVSNMVKEWFQQHDVKDPFTGDRIVI